MLQIILSCKVVLALHNIYIYIYIYIFYLFIYLFIYLEMREYLYSWFRHIHQLNYTARSNNLNYRFFLVKIFWTEKDYFEYPPNTNYIHLHLMVLFVMSQIYQPRFFRKRNDHLER